MSLFRLLLLVYPRSFRRAYGEELVESLSGMIERTRRERGHLVALGLVVRSVLDVLVTGVGQRIRAGSPENEEEGMMGRAVFHVRQAINGLRRSPGYAAAFVVTLGLAIGVNSAVFSLVNGVLLKPLPFPDADRILFLKQPVSAAGVDNALFSFIEIDDYRLGASTIEEFVEFGDWEFTVLGNDRPHRAVGGLVTSNWFEVMGMSASLGRVLGPEDDRQGAEPVAVLTHAYWERVFGGDPSVMGRVIRLENLISDFTPTRIVGVLEPGRHYTSSRRPDFYVNYATNDHYQSAAMRDARDHRMTGVFARLAPGATLEQARAELESIAAGLHREHPDVYEPEMGYGVDVRLWRDELTKDGRSTFLLLMGTVAVILLLAGANVTNLTLTRLIRREDELATRGALGATRIGLRLHLTAEHLLLGLAGGVLGVLLAFAAQESLASYAARFTVRAQEVGVDWTVLGTTLGGGMLLAVLLAWLPGLPVAPGPAGSASARSKATGSRGRKRLQRSLVVAQLAISFALLSGAGLLVRSLIELGSVDPGFRTEQILTMESPTGPSGAALPMMADPGWEAALHEIRSFPGVRAAAVANWTPLSAPTPTTFRVVVEGEEDGREHAHPTASNSVSPGYFEMLGIPLVQGRTFDVSDRDDSPDVIILNQSMARSLFGDVDPIGRRVSFEADYRTVLVGGSYEVVGVVADSKEYGFTREGVHTFYRPAAKTTWGPAILVASSGEPGALSEHVREVIHTMDPARAVEGIRTMESLVDQAMAPSRLNAVLVGTFAVLALLIAGVGVLGMLAFSVSQRIREFGIRMALGADQARVLHNVVGEGLALVAGALVLGVGGALVLGRFLALLLYNVEPLDPVSLVAAAAILGTVALTAAFLPALRATRIQPSRALKAE